MIRRNVYAAAPGSAQSQRIVYSWKNINVFSSLNVKGFCSGTIVEEKHILQNVTGVVQSGDLLAIMGGSGAGKTTLLNVLTFRNLKQFNVEGERSVNQIATDEMQMRELSAYVQQEDLFIGTLTVREHLTFQARLSMKSSFSYEQMMKEVENIIKELGLTKCSDNLIGITGKIKGISGGEKKRLAIASEVLSNPQIIFCDEPTSGLDSSMAEIIINFLRNLASIGKTIICTIHQPSSQVYSKFNKILFMAEGRTAFLGSQLGAKHFFESNGCRCPSDFNPSDFFIGALTIRPNNEINDKNRINRVCEIFSASNENRQIIEIVSANSAVSPSGSQRSFKYNASWFQQFRSLSWRNGKSIIKDPMALKGIVAQNIIVALVLGIFYLHQKLNEEGVQNINGAIFLMLSHCTYSNMFPVINVFCEEMPIFWREHFNGLYRLDTLFLSKTLVELPILIFSPLMFIAICYWMIGLNPLYERFAVTCGIAVLISNVSAAFGYVISAATEKVNLALVVAPACIVPLVIVGGFLLNKDSIPEYFQWLKYMSWFLYSNELLAINQWIGVKDIQCPKYPNATSTCPPNGEVVLNVLNFSKKNYEMDFYALGIQIAAYRLFAFLILLFKAYPDAKFLIRMRRYFPSFQFVLWRKRVNEGRILNRPRRSAV